MAQFILTIQTAVAAQSLAEELVSLCDNVTIRQIEVYWETGLGVHSQQVSEVSATLGDLWVPIAIERTEEWFRREAINTIVLTISPPVLSHRIGRND